ISDSVLEAGEESPAHSRIDLLTVVMQAMGKIFDSAAHKPIDQSPFSTQSAKPQSLKLIEESPEIMNKILRPGVRHVLVGKPIGRNVTSQGATGSLALASRPDES